MEQKLSDTLVKAIDRSNPMMQNLQLASRFNKLIDEGGDVELEDNKEVSITENGEIEITPTEGKDGMKKVTANVNVPSGGDTTGFSVQCISLSDDYITCVEFPRSTKVTAVTFNSPIIAGGVQKGYAVFGTPPDEGIEVTVVYDDDTYSYTYADRDYESHELVKENP